MRHPLFFSLFGFVFLTLFLFYFSFCLHCHVRSEPLREQKYFLVNRLDRDTSGLIVIAKSSKFCGKLSQIFMTRDVEKSYIGLCCGELPSWEERLVVTGHGRSRHGMWRVYDQSDIGRKLPFGSKVKEMVTKLKFLREVSGVEVDTASNFSSSCDEQGKNSSIHYFLVEATLLTGRTHQIRLHCQFLGIPLVGDIKYGGPQVWIHRGKSYDSHALHSSYLKFFHPETSKEVELSSPLPSWAM